MTHMTLQAVRQLIANDSYAITFQSMEQYRSTLLRHFDSLVEAPIDTPAKLEPALAAQSQGAQPTVKGRSVYAWYVTYCETSEKLKAAKGCIERYAAALAAKAEAPAAQQAAAPGPLADWRLVPDEPTDQMTYIGQKMRYDPMNSISSIYCAMLDAAPSAPSTPEAPKELGLDIAVAVNQRISKYIAGNKPALMLLNEEELAALYRFQETCEDSDSGGYDVDKDMMKRLAAIGVIESKGFGRYQFTEFGDFVVKRAAQLGGSQGEGRSYPCQPAT